MTASEFAFLALGLVLGLATGSALVMVLGSRPPAREVRLTVEHDAVPRRAATLSADAFSISPAEVARGGPADRRMLDRDEPPEDVPPPGARRPVFAAFPSPDLRTPVPSGGPTAIPIVAERDPALDALRVAAAVAATRLYRTGFPSASAVLEARAEPVTAMAAIATGTATASTAPGVRPAADPPADLTPAITRILRGDHRALLATVVTLAGADDAERRPWHAALMTLADALVTRAAAEGWLDFPVGNPFWDSFTTEQCRSIAGALAASGYRIDRVDGWADGRVPGYRELTAAVASSGLEPRRIRAWPTQDEIGAAYAEVTVAADDYLAHNAPDLAIDVVQAMVGADRGDGSRLWASWDRVSGVLLAPAGIS